MKHQHIPAILFILGAVCSSINPVQAQTSSALIEACNAVADAQKRLECLKAAFGTAQPKGSEKTEAIISAFTGFWGRLETGISLVNYQSALSNLGQDFAVFKSSADETQSEAIDSLGKSLEAYRDAAEFWSQSISFYARRDNRISYGGGLPVNMVGIGWMLGKYDLPTTKADVWGIQTGVPTDSGRLHIWKKAKELTDKGTELLKPTSAKN